MNPYEILSLVSPALIGSIQCGLIYYGLHVMKNATDKRARDMDQRHEEEMKGLDALVASHAESRNALGALIEGQRALISNSLPRT